MNGGGLVPGLCGASPTRSSGITPLHCRGSTEMCHTLMCFQGEEGCSCFIGQVMAVLTCCSYIAVCEIQSALKQDL